MLDLDTRQVPILTQGISLLLTPTEKLRGYLTLTHRDNATSFLGRTESLFAVLCEFENSGTHSYNLNSSTVFRQKSGKAFLSLLSLWICQNKLFHKTAYSEKKYMWKFRNLPLNVSPLYKDIIKNVIISPWVPTYCNCHEKEVKSRTSSRRVRFHSILSNDSFLCWLYSWDALSPHLSLAAMSCFLFKCNRS